ncbi:exonuclease domain-containing protein [Glutamicibacter sp. NPDC087344]|uniref:exonuclease domain-containing protein n=1 Tax=Glutamicibacter sp. NPDC087344 TaxID=3363994 RepID=UPI003827672E
MANGVFSVLDTETTGLFPGGTDRIAEIAIVRMNRHGEILDRWETLVNPQRDLGKQSLHGIQSRDLLNAPTFKDLAEELHWRLSGTVVVAHNLSFDSRFLDAEFQRAGMPLPKTLLNQGLCTMRMSHQYLQGAGRSLQDCCDSFGIEIVSAHSAGGDAAATAILLSRYMELDGQNPEWNLRLDRAAQAAWVQDSPSGRIIPVHRSSAPAHRAHHFLDRLTTRLPEFVGSEAQENYLAVLDRALLDRYLSTHEEQQLISLAGQLGLDRSGALELHKMYFQQLVRAAWTDGTVSPDEQLDLRTVADLLGLGRDLVRHSLMLPARKADNELSKAPGERTIALGSLVVLTGEMAKPRRQIEAALNAAGYVPHPAITKKVSLLVAADPDTLSGKAKKARDYGIPVASEDYLWTTLLS